MLAVMQQDGLDTQGIEREKERLKLKRSRILKQHRDGYIDDTELQAEMAAVELALRGLDVPEMDGLQLDDIIEAGERLPGIAALWEVATPEERREMVLLMLEPSGLYYDLELKEIAPRFYPSCV
jgi:site-specific DNA recombinase